MENPNSNQPPIACDLTVFSLGERERHLALSQELFAACGKMRELSDGFTFLFPGKGTWCAKIAEWVMLERRCCPSYLLSLFSKQIAARWSCDLLRKQAQKIDRKSTRLNS